MPATLEAIQDRKDTAYRLWRALRVVFLDNRDTRATFLSTEFRSFCQGDLSILEYCSKLKSMAETLCDLGSPVKECDLVLNVLCGLNQHFHHAIPHVTMQPRLPGFIKTCSFLPLEERRVLQSERMAAHTALMAQAYQAEPSGSLPPGMSFLQYGLLSSAPSAPSSSTTGGSSAGSGKKKDKKKSVSGGGSSGGGTSSSAGRAPKPAAPPEPFFSPAMAGTF